jgi:hypothetical protein
MIIHSKMVKIYSRNTYSIVEKFLYLGCIKKHKLASKLYKLIGIGIKRCPSFRAVMVGK